MHRQIRTLALAIVTFAMASTVYGQTCRGMTGIHSESPIALGGGLEFSETTTLIGGTVAGGSDSFFMAGTIGSLEFDDIRDSAMVLGATIGGQVAADFNRRFMICPSATVSNTFGPNNIGGSGVDASFLSFGGGASVGAVVANTGVIQLVPTTGLAVARVRTKVSFLDGDAIETDTVGIFDAGLGIVLNERFSVTPRIVVPFGSQGTEKSFVLSFGIAFPR